MTDEKKTRKALSKAQIQQIYQMRWNLNHPKVIAEKTGLPESRVRHCINQLAEVLKKQKREFPSLPRNRVRLIDIVMEVVAETKVENKK